MRARTAFALVVVFLLSGCGPPQKYRTADEVYTKTISTHDAYKKATWVKSPTVRVYHPYQTPYSTGYSDLLLRTLVVEGRSEFHQLYVTFYGYDWIFFNRAYDINGNQLKFTKIDRVVASLGIQEDFVITLAEDYLESATKSGLNIKFVGKRGERVVTLGPHYVEGYLKKYRKLTSR